MERDLDREEVKNFHYSVPSMYGKEVRKQYDMQPKYCEADGEMKGAHSNPQTGA